MQSLYDLFCEVFGNNGKGKAMSDAKDGIEKPAGPFKVRWSSGSFVLTYPDGSEVIAPIIWNYVEAWVNSAYRLGREEEKKANAVPAQYPAWMPIYMDGYDWSKWSSKTKPVPTSRKFIGGPLDGLSFTLDGWTKQTKYAGELHTGIGGAIDFLKTDCGHTYKLGTVNGEQMMVYERRSK